MSDPSAAVRISVVEVNDFKGIKHIKFRPDPHVVLVVGKNEQGKTSIFDALKATLGGARNAPDSPLRNGAAVGVCRVELSGPEFEGLRVNRRWTDDGKTKLYVEKADGTPMKGAQEFLDGLNGGAPWAFAFDPGAFCRMSAREQAEVLRTALGLDAAFADIDREAAGIAEERRDVNRAVKLAEGALSEFPTEEELKAVPDAEPDVQALLAEYQRRVDQKAANDAAREAVGKKEKSLAFARQMLAGIDDRLAKLRAQVAETERDQADWVKDVAEAEAELTAARWSAADTPVDPDPESVKAEIAAAQATARRVRQKKERQDVWDRWSQNRFHAADLTKKLDALAHAKQDLLAAAALPVPGMTLTEDAVLLDGVPVAAHSTARQIRTGLAVLALRNPRLRTAFVQNGSLLDEDALDAVCRWSLENGYQVWLEIVGNRDSPSGVIIEEGLLYADRQPPRAPSAAPGYDPENDPALLF